MTVEVEITITVEVSGEYIPYDRGVSSGPVEMCYAPEGGYFDVESAKIGGVDIWGKLNAKKQHELAELAYDSAGEA